VIGDTWPPHYERLPFPSFGGFHGEWRLSWNGVVADRARILDPMFHGGNTEAIRLRVWVEEDHPLLGAGRVCRAGSASGSSFATSRMRTRTCK
jgi:hypothetical protein